MKDSTNDSGDLAEISDIRGSSLLSTEALQFLKKANLVISVSVKQKKQPK